MTQNEAYILAQELKGNTYSAGPNLWRVVVRVDKLTIRIYYTQKEYKDIAYAA